MKNEFIYALFCLCCILFVIWYSFISDQEKRQEKRLKYVKENFAPEFMDQDSLESVTINTTL